MSKIGKLYYEEGYTQDEIVLKMKLSRSKVSRLMKQARDTGIVKITVIPPPGIYSDLEMQLERRFRLLEVLIVEASPNNTPEELSRELGTAAASYFQRTVKDRDIIGVTWGVTMSCMVAAMQPLLLPEAHVLQMLGGLGQPEAEVHATELCRRLARLLDCKLTLLPSPGIVGNQRTKEALLSDSHIQKAFGLFPKINIAFAGVGAPTPTSVVVRDGSIINQTEVDDLQHRGAVGDIALRFFDCYGQPVWSDVDDRVVGITLEQITRIERVVGVAGGAQKKNALLGALRGGLIDVLITDQLTARLLLDDNHR